MSSSALSEVDRPAPDMPVTTSSGHRGGRAGSLMAPPKPPPAASVLSASRSFAAADAAKGSSDRSGTLTPSMVQKRGSGRRSIASSFARSTTSRNGARATCGTRTMPSPRTSRRPAIVAGALISRSESRRVRSVWSSATSLAPSSMRRSAKSDLPLPEGPRSRMPSPPTDTEVPWTRIIGRFRCAGSRLKSMVWQCTQWLITLLTQHIDYGQHILTRSREALINHVAMQHDR